MKRLSSDALVSALVGFTVASLTGVIFGGSVALQYPGTSLAAGLAIGLLFRREWSFALVGAIFGLGGWMVYRLLFSL